MVCPRPHRSWWQVGWSHTQILLLVRAVLGYTPIFVAGGVSVGGEASKRMAGILAPGEDSGSPAGLPLQTPVPTVRESQSSSCQTQAWLLQPHPPLSFSMPWPRG